MKNSFQKQARIFLTGMLLAIVMCYVTAATAQEQPLEQIEIRTVEDMLAIGNNLKGSYILMNDLTLDNWKPLGPFKGIFNGKGHTITLSIDITFSPEDKDLDVGLFSEINVGLLSYSSVSNLHVKGNIRCESPYKEINVGGIVGVNKGGLIFNCISEVDITVNAIEANVGGIVGYNRIGLVQIIGTSHVLCCYMTGNIEVKGEKNVCVGGIAGCNGTADIISCYAMGTVSVHEGRKQSVGHIIGLVKEVVLYLSLEPIRIDDVLLQKRNICSKIKNNVALNSLFSVSDKRKYTGDIIGHNAEKKCGHSKENNYLIVREEDSSNEDLNDKQNIAPFSATQNMKWWILSAGFIFKKDFLWVWNKSLKRPTLPWETINFENGELVIETDNGYEISEGAVWGTIEETTIEETVEEIVEEIQNIIRDTTQNTSPNIIWYLKDGMLTIGGYGNLPERGLGKPWRKYFDSITSIVIEGYITRIGSMNFAASKATSITIGESVESIGISAFNSCKKVVSVKVKRAVPPKMDRTAFTFSPVKKMQLIVPIGAKEAYLKDKRWKKFGTIIEEDFGQ
jgi:hypothetical protein